MCGRNILVSHSQSSSPRRVVMREVRVECLGMGMGGDKAVVVVVTRSGNTGWDAHGTGWRSGARVEMYRMIVSRVGGPTVT